MAKTDNNADIKFFKEEVQWTMDVESVTSVTFYKGHLPLEFLRIRIHEIIRLNPWLNGRLIKQDGEIVLKYTRTQELPPLCTGFTDTCFQVINVMDLPSEAHDSNQNYFWLTKYAVEHPRNCVGRDKPLFLVHLVELSTDRFALVVSVSHLLSDGHGFYELYGMLSQNSSARTLDAVRNFELKAKVKEKTSQSLQLFSSMGMICNAIGRFLFHKKSIYQSRRINAQWIEKQKQDFAEFRRNRSEDKEDSTVTSSGTPLPVPEFISSNDILTSQFFTTMKANIGMMAVNFRNRIENLTNDHVANYEGIMLYHPVDFASPALIRQSISNDLYLPAITGNNPICPGFFKRRKAKIGLITNWASLYKHISFEGCEHVLHSPLISFQPPVVVVGVVFKTNATDLALLIVDNNSKQMDVLSSLGVVGEVNIDFTPQLF